MSVSNWRFLMLFYCLSDWPQEYADCVRIKNRDKQTNKRSGGACLFDCHKTCSIKTYVLGTSVVRKVCDGILANKTRGSLR